MGLDGTTILITGGTGSFGEALVERLLTGGHSGRIIVFSRDEFKQHRMRQRFIGGECHFVVGDVRDRDSLERALEGAEVVVHAAALKQVPTCESHPGEAIRTNVEGTRNVVEAALRQGVRQLLAISTDKAAYPTCTYGATKLLAEKLVLDADGRGGLVTACCRFGNFVRSRGSVIPFFEEQQRHRRPIPITDQRMTRFWIPLEEATRFALERLDDMGGGELFIPRMPGVPITAIARAVAPDCPVELVGLRPGEKLHQSLVGAEEARYTRVGDDLYVVLATERSRRNDRWLQAEPLPEARPLRSDVVSEGVDPEEMVGLIRSWL